jgi:hypothetical protein
VGFAGLTNYMRAMPDSLDKKGGRRCLLLLNKRWNLDGIFFPLFRLMNLALVNLHHILSRLLYIQQKKKNPKSYCEERNCTRISKSIKMHYHTH